jgi:pilus assembly protein CpaD
MIRRKRRFPSRRGRSGRLGFLIAGAALVALASCAPETAYWSPAESPKTVRVDWVNFAHTVRFPARGSELSTEERARLDRFLGTVSPDYGDQIMVGTGTAADADPAGGQRVAAVRRLLEARRVPATALPPSPEATAWDGSVRLVVGRYVVTPPNCPDWSKDAGEDRTNRPASNFSCATATNLGLMVANPGDLIRGREMGPTDGEHATRVIRVYRGGNQYAPPMINPSPDTIPVIAKEPDSSSSK